MTLLLPLGWLHGSHLPQGSVDVQGRLQEVHPLREGLRQESGLRRLKRRAPALRQV